MRVRWVRVRWMRVRRMRVRRIARPIAAALHQFDAYLDLGTIRNQNLFPHLNIAQRQKASRGVSQSIAVPLCLKPPGRFLPQL